MCRQLVLRHISRKPRACFRWHGKCFSQQDLMATTPLEQVQAERGRFELHGTQVASRLERRKRVRFDVRWPVCFFGVEVGRTVETRTENLSSSGFHCLSPVQLPVGDLMICVLGVPSPRPLHNGRALSLECKVRILRVEPADERQSYGIACEIEDYRYYRYIESDGRRFCT